MDVDVHVCVNRLIIGVHAVSEKYEEDFIGILLNVSQVKLLSVQQFLIMLVVSKHV